MAPVPGADREGRSRPDADVWRELGQSDESAFRVLFERHHQGVYTYCFRRTASWAVAEDAVQATFLTLWRRAVAATSAAAASGT